MLAGAALFYSIRMIYIFTLHPMIVVYYIGGGVESNETPEEPGRRSDPGEIQQR